jgi:hypothetical protein
MPRIETVALGLLIAVGCLYSARAADSDFQLWAPVQVVHSINDAWDLSMQVELRLRDDISDFSQLVLKPAANFKINDTWTLALGYKYIIRGQTGNNEHDPWQELHFNQKDHDLVWGLQLRLEERLRQERNGVLPRLRLLGHASHPIGETPWYLTGGGGVGVNWDE